MKKLIMYCLCLHDNFFKILKKIHYKPVGLGSNYFLGDHLRDNVGKNISFKNKYYGEYTFHYWFWKNMLNKLKDNSWVGFCAYRRFWANNKNLTSDQISKKVNLSNFNKFVLKEPMEEWKNYDTILGEEMFIEKNIKLSKVIKNGGINVLIKHFMPFVQNKSNLKFHFDTFHGCGKIDKAINLLDKKDKNDFNEFLNKRRSFNRGNMFICKSKNIMNQYYKSVFKWLKKCEDIFSFKDGNYGETRIYAFLAERYLSFWFNKYSNCLTWPIFYFDTQLIKKNEM